jgi:hypothetical protein
MTFPQIADRAELVETAGYTFSKRRGQSRRDQRIGTNAITGGQF